MILDNLKKIEAIDRSHVYDSVVSLAAQCQHAYQSVTGNHDFVRQPKVKNIVMSGMGGSGLAARVIKSLYFDQLSLPMDLVNGYSLPGYADRHTFVILSSYSGNTEETLATGREALARHASVVSICAGGQLFEWSKSHHIPVYKIDPIYNPSNQPRMAIGYSIFGQLAMLAKAGLIKLGQEDVAKLVVFLARAQKALAIEKPASSNPAKKIAMHFYRYIPVLVGCEHIYGALHTTKNQLNENAKTFGVLFDIPELNHHLMEGLKHPLSNPQTLQFLFYGSKLFLPRNQKRYALTIDVVSQNKIKAAQVMLTGRTKLEQVFEAIQFGAFWQFYLTMLYGIDPAPIPWVDYFKKKL